MSDDILESAEAAKAPGTFNIIDVLQNRGYPETSIKIVIDESLAYEAAMLKEQIDKMNPKSSSAKMGQKQIEEQASLIDQLDEMREKIEKSSYTVHMMGISEGKREEIFRDARKKYPIEYDNSANIQDILGGQNKKIEKESPERDALFTDYLWLAHIKKIVNPDGDEQSDFTYNAVRAMRESFPLSAMLKVNEAMEKLRASTALFLMGTGEDFLAKP